MTRWKKRTLTTLLSLALLASLAVPALASGEIDTLRTGRVQLLVAEADYQEDLKESQATVYVYRVADVDPRGVFTLTEPFAALAENEQWNDGRLGAETRVQDLLGAAMALIWPEPAEGGQRSEKPLLEPDAETAAQVVGGELELGVGLYVLLPQEVRTERWAYAFGPVLLAVPSAEDGRWTYELPVTMKPEREPRLTELVIDKTLARYNATLGPATFLFDVEAELDGTNVYSNVVSLTFSGPGTQSVTAEGIPVGARVTVTEVYSGASYRVADGRASVAIESLPLPDGEAGAYRVGFTNDYDDHRIPDSSVVNTFRFNGTGWQWQSSEEVAEG